MKIEFCTSHLRELVKDKNICVLNNKFLKKIRAGDYIDTLYKIEANKKKLTSKYYSFVTKIYMDYGNPFLLESEYLENFMNLSLAILRKKDLNKSKIIRSIFQAIHELEMIGVDYWDIHSNNIMINDKEEIKLVDLSGAISNSNQQLFYNAYALMNLILEMYLFCNFQEKDYIKKILQVPQICSYFSTRVYKHMVAIENLEEDNLPLEEILREFEDEEKIETICLELKKVV